MRTSIIPGIASLLFLSSITMTSWAADLTWDGNVDSDWDTSTANWSGSTWNNATPDDATFDATATVGTVTLTENITAGNITFDLDGYTIDTTNGNLTITNGITANGSATISGANEVILGGDNTWDTASGKTLTVSSVISGGQALTKSGAGTLNLSGANTYTGTTTVSAGTLILAGGNAIANNRAVVMSNVAGALLQLDASETIGSLSGGGANGGDIDLQSHTLTIFQSSNLTFAGDISGSGGLTKRGNARLTLTGDRAFSGKVLVEQGRLRISGNNGELFNATELEIEAGATFENNGRTSPVLEKLSGAGDYIYNNKRVRSLTIGSNDSSSEFSGNLSNSQNSSNLIKVGNGTFTLSGISSLTGATTISGGTLELGNGGASGSLTGTSGITNNGNLTVNRNNAFTQATDLNGQDITGTGSFTQAGTGTTTLSLANTYDGTTTVSNGTLLINGDHSGATGAVTVTAGTLGGNGTVGGATTIGTGATLTAGTTGNADTLAFNSDLTINGGATITWNLINESLGAGTGWDLFTVNGDLASGGGTITFDIQDSSSFDFDALAPGTIKEFDVWQTSNLTGFNTGDFTLSYSGSNFNGSSGSFVLAEGGAGVVVRFTAVPEPSTCALMGLGLAAFGWARRSRKRTAVDNG